LIGSGISLLLQQLDQRTQIGFVDQVVTARRADDAYGFGAFDDDSDLVLGDSTPTFCGVLDRMERSNNHFRLTAPSNGKTTHKQKQAAASGAFTDLIQGGRFGFRGSMRHPASRRATNE